VDWVVTGEGVLLDNRPVSVASRLLGAIIDLVVLAVGLVLLLLGANALLSEVPTWDAVASVALIALVTVGVPTTVETLSRGRSIGKLVVGVRIVRDDGGPVLLRQTFVRALTGVVELWLTFGAVALICSMFHPKGKRVGDVLAGTYAVRVRGKTQRPVELVMPPHLAAWAHGADVARLPDGLALSVRQFLARAPQLHPGSRVELGTALTREVERYVRPLPPGGTHPEEFLAAVIAERRDRELHRLHREAQLEAAEAALVQRLPHEIPDPVD
jgi:uncharacterized RDD family membrane protein YckC